MGRACYARLNRQYPFKNLQQLPITTTTVIALTTSPPPLKLNFYSMHRTFFTKLLFIR